MVLIPQLVDRIEARFKKQSTVQEVTSLHDDDARFPRPIPVMVVSRSHTTAVGSFIHFDATAARQSTAVRVCLRQSLDQFSSWAGYITSLLRCGVLHGRCYKCRIPPIRQLNMS